MIRQSALLLASAAFLAAPAHGVVSGIPIPPGDRAYDPLLRLSFKGARCTGTHLGGGRILTARHCAETNDVDLCVWNARDRSLGCVFGGSYRVSHPALKVLDVAVLELGRGRLRERVAELDAVVPSFEAPAEGAALEIAGQGCAAYWPGFFERDGSGELRHGPAALEPATQIFLELVWTPGGAGAGACQGDSGGPIYALEAGRMVQYGVARSITKPKDGSRAHPLPVRSRYHRLGFGPVRRWLESLL
jgi:hypothetical protein